MQKGALTVIQSSFDYFDWGGGGYVQSGINLETKDFVIERHKHSVPSSLAY